MAGRKVQVALLATLLLLMSGCIYADTPEWGTGDGQIKVTIDSSSNTADIQSKMGEGYSNDNVPLIECENSTIKVTGLIISSQVYSEHPLDDSIQSAMGAAVIIHKMSYSEAENFEEGPPAESVSRIGHTQQNQVRQLVQNYLKMKMTGLLLESFQDTKILLKD